MSKGIFRMGYRYSEARCSGRLIAGARGRIQSAYHRKGPRWRAIFLAGPAPTGPDTPNGPNGLIEPFVIIETSLEGYRGLASLRCGRRPSQSAKDLDRHPGRPPGGRDRKSVV